MSNVLILAWTYDIRVYINTNVIMRTHVTAVVRACFAALHLILSMQRSLSCHALLTLVCALIVNKVDYGNSVLAGIYGHWTAARPVAVHLECRRPFVFFFSEAVWTHNLIASWTLMVASYGASHIRAVHSGLPLSSWNSTAIPCWELSPDIWRRHSMLSAFRWHSHAGGTVHQTFNARRPCLPSAFGTCAEQPDVVYQECTIIDDVQSRAEDCTFPVVIWRWLGHRDCTAQYNCCLSRLLTVRASVLFVFCFV